LSWCEEPKDADPPGIITPEGGASSRD
jgi:hypothetical protein